MERAEENSKETARGFEKSVSRKKTSLASCGYSNLEGKFCKLQVLYREQYTSTRKPGRYEKFSQNDGRNR